MIELAPHQLEAVTRILALLDRYGGAILADDVGLGKSFVAAAVAVQMKARRSAVEVIVPASLVAQWRDTLREFAVEARTITHDSLIGDRFVAGGERRHRLRAGDPPGARRPSRDASLRRARTARGAASRHRRPDRRAAVSGRREREPAAAVRLAAAGVEPCRAPRVDPPPAPLLPARRRERQTAEPPRLPP